jgi:hypothetical protein
MQHRGAHKSLFHVIWSRVSSTGPNAPVQWISNDCRPSKPVRYQTCEGLQIDRVVPECKDEIALCLGPLCLALRDQGRDQSRQGTTRWTERSRESSLYFHGCSMVRARLSGPERAQTRRQMFGIGSTLSSFFSQNMCARPRMLAPSHNHPVSALVFRFEACCGCQRLPMGRSCFTGAGGMHILQGLAAARSSATMQARSKHRVRRPHSAPPLRPPSVSYS